jgi:hypothetical protein
LKLEQQLEEAPFLLLAQGPTQERDLILILEEELFGLFDVELQMEIYLIAHQPDLPVLE